MYAVVALKSPVIDNINTTNITWSLLKFNNYSSASGAHLVYLPEANYRYTVELSGGNCVGAELQHVNVTSTHYRLPDPKCHHTSNRGTILHGGANYTVRVRAWSINNDSIASNFSQTKSFTTEARGVLVYITDNVQKNDDSMFFFIMHSSMRFATKLHSAKARSTLSDAIMEHGAMP